MRYFSEDENKQNRIELCTHTGFSQNKGIGSPLDLVKKAKLLGISALAICDNNSTAGFEEFNRACINANIAPIFGTTVNIGSDEVVLLAKNSNGIRNLNRVISKIYENSSNTVLSYEHIKDLISDIITINLWRNFETVENLIDGLKRYDYIGIEPSNNIDFSNINESLLNRFVAVSNSYYLNKTDKFLYDSLTGCNTNKNMHLRSTEELLSIYPKNIVFDNPNTIFNDIEKNIFKTDNNEFIIPNVITADKFRAIIKKESSNNLKFKKDHYKGALEKELNGVVASKFYNLFYLAYELKKYLQKNNELFEIRGLGLSSLLLYILGLSNVDPIQNNLYSNAFLGINFDDYPLISIITTKRGKQLSQDFFVNFLGIENVIGGGKFIKYDNLKSLKTAISYLEKNDEYYENIEEVQVFKLKNTVSEIDYNCEDFYFKNDCNDFLSKTAILKRDGMFISLNESNSLRTTFSRISINVSEEMELLKKLEVSTGVKIQDVPLNDPTVMSIFNKRSSIKFSLDFRTSFECVYMFGAKHVKEILDVTKPKNLSDLIKVVSLSQGYEVRENNVEFLIKKGFSLDEVITNREDIYELLTLKYNIYTKDAFCIMEDVRKGRGIRKAYVSTLKSNNVPEYLIESFNKITYASSRAIALQNTIIGLKELYFKIHYPLEFYTAYFDTKYNYNFLSEFLKISPEDRYSRYIEGESINERCKLLCNISDLESRGYNLEQILSNINKINKKM